MRNPLMFRGLKNRNPNNIALFPGKIKAELYVAVFFSALAMNDLNSRQ